VPLDFHRLGRLRKVKNNMKQADLARAAGVTQTHVSMCESGEEVPSVELLEKFAVALDCTPDFLLHWSFLGVDEDDDAFRAAVSSMAFDAFAERINVGTDQKDRCRKVLRHPIAPLTADGWAILSEQIDLAIGLPPSGDLRLVHGGGI
jgi:transcriptional regulator with XRE-family HTH domain